MTTELVHEDITYAPLGFPEDLTFGLELEHGSSPGYDIDALAGALYESGYGRNTLAWEHHSSGGAAYYFHERGWVTEFEGTLPSGGGEVVSPVMRDSIETWQAVDAVLTLIKNAGGTDDTSEAGGHIHFDTVLLSDDLACWQTFLGYLHHFSDALYTFGTHEGRGEHRGRKHCEMPPPCTASELPELLAYYRPSRYALNTSYVRSTGIGHVEYRVNDASLDYRTVRERVSLIGNLMVRAANKTTPPRGRGVESLVDFALG